jgi:hypothetical protein
VQKDWWTFSFSGRGRSRWAKPSFMNYLAQKNFSFENHQTGLEIGQEQRGDEQGAKDGFDAI